MRSNKAKDSSFSHNWGILLSLFRMMRLSPSWSVTPGWRNRSLSTPCWWGLSFLLRTKWKTTCRDCPRRMRRPSLSSSRPPSTRASPNYNPTRRQWKAGIRKEWGSSSRRGWKDSTNDKLWIIVFYYYLTKSQPCSPSSNNKQTHKCEKSGRLLTQRPVDNQEMRIFPRFK